MNCYSTNHVAAYYRHLASRAAYTFARWNYLDTASRYQLAANRKERP